MPCSPPIALVLVACSIAIAPNPVATAADLATAELVRVGAAPVAAAFLGVESGRLQFKREEGERIDIEIDQLVRWSTPRPSRSPDELLLRDGTRLRIAAAWDENPTWTLDATSLKARVHQLGQIEVPRQHVLALLLKLPPDELERHRIIDAFLQRQAENESADLILLDNGDALTGTVKGGDKPSALKLAGSLGELPIPVDRIHGIALFAATPLASTESRAARPPLLLGLASGHVVAANSLAVDAEQLLLDTPSLGELRVPVSAVASMQGFGASCVYLSDFAPSHYEHTPYLELQWPYHEDRNALGELLRAGDQIYAKGLGLHSASELIYRLNGQFDRFAAAVALDDASGFDGSVVFRVLLKREKAWQEVFASETIRGGDPPQHVAVDVAGASELRLAVEYADRGDERDYANWLDARLERTEGAGAP